MIGHLAGALREKTPEGIVVDVGGVGYQVLVSLRTYAALGGLGERVEVSVHTHVREDAIQLFGFLDPSERALFRKLQSVSGIGPKLALNMLSGIAAGDLTAAIRAGDVGRLTTIPGVGKRTAERIVLELRDKLGEAGAPAPGALGGDAASAASALANLGYRPADAEKAVSQAVTAGKIAFEDLVREALRRLSR